MFRLAAAEYEFFLFDETPETVREKKFHNFHKNINMLNHELDKKINNSISGFLKNKKLDLVIYNPNRTDWKQTPVEIRLHFKPKFMTSNFDVHSFGKVINSQLEDIKFYKDGCIRSVTLVITPIISKNSKIGITLVKNNTKLDLENHPQNFVKTNNVEISLSKTGGMINSLKFPTISEKPIINTIGIMIKNEIIKLYFKTFSFFAA